MNILGNALKYTQTGFISIDLRRHEETKKSGSVSQKVKLTIIDSGRGMSKDFLRNRLFDPFTQEDPLDQGTGLGMTIVRQITKRLGGSVHVESRVNHGTAVTITLPFTEPTTEAPPDPLLDRVDKLRGLRVSLRGFKTEAARVGLSGRWIIAEAEAMATLCRDWLRLEVVQDESDVCADLIIRTDQGADVCAAQEGTDSMAPTLIITHDTLVAQGHKARQKQANERSVYEFIGIPAGPRKLAHSLLLAFERWEELKSAAPTLDAVDTSLSMSSDESLQNPPSTEDVMIQLTAPFPTQGSDIPDICSESRRVSIPTHRPSLSRQPTLLSQGTYLLVDDNKINLQILVAFMKKLKKPYVTANDGLEAYRAYQSEPQKYACVLMDISMPVMDGLESTRKIRQHEKGSGLPATKIIALTGLLSAEAKNEAFASGVDLYMTKPVQLKRLSETLATLFQ